MKFEFETDDQAEAYCEAIANEMEKLFGVSVTETVGRINGQWRGQSLIGEDCMIHRETTEAWAKLIYFECDPAWWTVPNPKTCPYP